MAAEFVFNLFNTALSSAIQIPPRRNKQGSNPGLLEADLHVQYTSPTKQYNKEYICFFVLISSPCYNEWFEN